MAYGPIKIEMKGTGGGRWCRREAAKTASKKLRRLQSKRLIKQELARIA